MQQAIERVECGATRKKSKRTRKATLGMMTLPELRFFCGTVAPRPENPRLLSLFPREINFDAPPFRMLGASFIHAMIVFARCDSCTP